MKNEVWRDIEGYPGYQVSSEGRVKNVLRDYIHKARKINHLGYQVVSIKCDVKLIHRLVAKAFPEICGEWFDECEVHHIDHNPTNNTATNLKILSKDEHREYHKDEFVYTKGSPKRVAQYTYDWVLIAVYNDTISASDAVRGDKEALRRACRGDKSSTHYYKGYRWLYIENGR